MKRFHIAVGVVDVQRSIEDYSRRLECLPSVVVPGEYALWRTAALNFSIRRSAGGVGAVRHLGWEDALATEFSQDTDVNGIVWEQFSAEQQRKEIEDTWPAREADPVPSR